MEKKTCQKCFNPKPISDFLVTKAGNIGGSCFSCRSEYLAEYRKNNHDRLKALNKSYRDNLKEKPAIKLKKHTINPLLCDVSRCKEHKGSFYGFTTFCKSHAFDHFNLEKSV